MSRGLIAARLRVALNGRPSRLRLGVGGWRGTGALVFAAGLGVGECAAGLGVGE